ncbi:hypothetical protein [Nonomuraea sp. NPDC023979]|uniref:hypothetical protein n=1 Tax=Nonomuraea sp. NPDC023979 TaxID=3154796 RepID=UPI0033CFB768
MTAFLALAVGLAACGAQGGAAPAGPTGATGPTGPPPRYTATVTVLEDGTHGPQMCRALLESMPPQCGGPDVVGWDWSKVRHESAASTRWGLYVVTGTWDGERLTLTEPPRPAEGGADRPDRIGTPCPAPEGGWKPVDPARTTPDAMNEAIARAGSAKEFAGAWIDRLDPDPPEEGEDHARDVVLNLAFTGDLSGREAWIREVWGGALCVTGAKRTRAELYGIQERVMDEKGVLEAATSETRNRVEATMWLATPEQRERLAAAYGDAVVVEDVLKPAG